MDVKLYKSYNHMQTNDARMILEEVGHTLHWRERECILDIGSGPGNVTANILKPFISKNSILIGSDISDEMVNCANKNFSSDSLTFKRLDIENKLIWDKWNKAEFDKIFSFYCLHWIQDIKQAVINIHTLLKPGGESLLVMLTENPLYVLFKALVSSSPRWSSYMQDVNKLKAPLQISKNPVQDFSDLLKSVNFSNINVTQKKCTYTFPSKESLDNAILAVTPFLNNIPQHLQPEFLEDITSNIAVCKNHEIKTDGSWDVKYTLLVARASKP